METIKKTNGYEITFNGSKTYFLNDDNGDCLGYFDTERKANNALKRVLKDAGIV